MARRSVFPSYLSGVLRTVRRQHQRGMRIVKRLTAGVREEIGVMEVTGEETGATTAMPNTPLMRKSGVVIME